MTMYDNTLQQKRVTPNRVLEIKLYFFFKKLSRKYDKNINSIIIECFVNMSPSEECTVDTMNELYREFITDRNPLLIPSKEETVYFLNKSGVSLRDIYKYTGISLMTQQKIKRYIKEHPEQTPIDRPHIKPKGTEDGRVIIDYHTCMSNFLDAVEEFNKLW